MGKGGGVQQVQRDLTPQELKLIEQQSTYIDKLQPSINQLIDRGTALLPGVVNPDYQSMYQKSQYDLNGVRQGIDSLAQGKLPSAYTNSKTDYYNQMYNNTFGNMLADKAKAGVIGGSVLNKSIDSMQKNMAAQMSADYNKDLQTQSGLLQQQQQAVYQPLTLGTTANQASFNNAGQYLGLAAGKNLGANGTDVLNAVGNLNNNSSAFVQNSGKGLL